MKFSTTLIVSVLFLGGALATDKQSLAQGDCGDGPSSYKLMIHVSDNRPDRVTNKGNDATDFEVCSGDTVEWQLVGSNKQFWVDFLDGAPFSGGERKNSNNNGKISVVIGGEANEYPYDIGLVDGEAMDPKIIIRD